MSGLTKDHSIATALATEDVAVATNCGGAGRDRPSRRVASLDDASLS